MVFLLVGAIVSTAFFGLAPALRATRFELVRTMRGEVTRDARPGRPRQALIAIQVGASALLLICAAVFPKCPRRRKCRLRRADERHGEALDRQRATAWRAASGREAHPSVVAVAALSLPMGVVAETSRSPDTTADRASGDVEPSAGRVAGRVAGMLRCGWRRCRERARLPPRRNARQRRELSSSTTCSPRRPLLRQASSLKCFAA